MQILTATYQTVSKKITLLFRGAIAWILNFVHKNTISRHNVNNIAPAMALAAMPLVTVPIQEVQLLDYAVAHKTVNSTYGLTASTDDDIYRGLMDKAPYTSDQQRARDKYELNNTDWHEVVFEEIQGSSIAKLALHKDRIQKQGYKTEKVVILNLPEQGINGEFRITAIKHILPQKKPECDAGDGYDWEPVTGIFIHQSSDVYSIHFENGDKLGVTYQHPIFSITHNDWRLAGELKVGEEVLTKSGNTKVLSSTKKEGSETVYNLEVKELHNFLVGESGVVVHNSCIKLISNAADELKLRNKIKSTGGISDDIVQEIVEEIADEGAEQVKKKGRKLTWPELRALWKRGNDFNKKARNNDWYDVHELHLKNGKRLDSYDHDLGEIVSRKATDFDNIEKRTFEKYLKEIDQKYAPGTEIRSNAYPDLDGELLHGQKILEVPASNQSASKLAEFQTLASQYNTIIRFRPE